MNNDILSFISSGLTYQEAVEATALDEEYKRQIRQNLVIPKARKFKYSKNENIFLQGTFSTTDHKGRVFKSKTEMCAFYGISMDTFNSRLNRGYSLELALTKGKN